jgi:hypothetical protein
VDGKTKNRSGKSLWVVIRESSKVSFYFPGMGVGGYKKKKFKAFLLPFDRQVGESSELLL